MMIQPTLSTMLPYQYTMILSIIRPMLTKLQSNAPLTTTQNKYCRYPANMLQRYDNTMNILYNQQTIANNSIPRPESTEAHSWRIRSKDAHALGVEGGTPRPAPRPGMPCYVTQDQDILCNVIYCVFLLMPFICYICSTISTGTKPISREDAHPMYPRYLHVCLYMLLFTAHSPTQSL